MNELFIMPKPRGEEQFPLLLVLVGDQDISQNNKRLFRGRFNGITSGATAIITEWPNYLSSCWLTALVCGIALFIISLLFSSCMTIQQRPRLPRCSSDSPIVANNTIHLVHTSHKWHPHQIELLKYITSKFPDFQINLLIIGNKDWSRIKRHLNETRFNKTKKSINETQLSETNAYLDPLLLNIQKNSSKMIISHKTYQAAFENSPLFLSWASLDHKMRVFAARVLQIWQFGGVSFDLLEYKAFRRMKNGTVNFFEMKVKSLVQSGHERYEKLDPEGVSVDFNGLHLESKAPCHAFFGKILMNLMKLIKFNDKSTIKDVLTGPMWQFCRIGVIDKEFCHFKSILL